MKITLNIIRMKDLCLVKTSLRDNRAVSICREYGDLLATTKLNPGDLARVEIDPKLLKLKKKYAHYD